MRRRAALAALSLSMVATITGIASIELAPAAFASPLQKMDPRMRGHVSAFADEQLGPNRAAARASSEGNNYFPADGNGCAVRNDSNYKVNQNCLNISDSDLQGRAQAQNETFAATDPNTPQHVIATYNDYRRGDGACGVSFSLDQGHRWSDVTTPNGFTRGQGGPADFGASRQYWQAGGDTSVAWDTKGNAYLSCQVFNRGKPPTSNIDQSSALLVYRSTGNSGGSFNFPGRYVTASNDLAGTGTLLEDKQFLTVDNHNGSPFQDRIYVTWTHYTATTAYIEEAWSSDYGESFSAPVQISPAGNQSLCPTTLTKGGGCDNNQFSQPFTAPDGTLWVVYSNFNTDEAATQANYQVLIQKSTDGGHTFTAPKRVTEYYELPDCATYQGGLDAGRACIPEKGSSTNSIFRAANYPVGAVNPANPQQIAVSVGSYINSDSKESNGCHPTGVDPSSQGGLYDGVKTPGACANHIILALSSDGGAHWNGGSGVDPRQMPLAMQPSQRHSSQWFQWLAFGSSKMAVSMYDRLYGNDETTGSSDISLIGTKDMVRWGLNRITSSSMPTPTQFSGTFWGDYSGMTTFGDMAMPVWSDTRSPDLFLCPGTATGPGSPPHLCGLAVGGGTANDEDIFARSADIPVPN